MIPPSVCTAICREIYCTQSETANQSQQDHLTSINSICVNTAHTLPPLSVYPCSSSRLQEQPNVTGKLLISESCECALAVYPSSLLALLLRRLYSNSRLHCGGRTVAHHQSQLCPFVSKIFNEKLNVFTIKHSAEKYWTLGC